jgi:hypothetical protein
MKRITARRLLLVEDVSPPDPATARLVAHASGSGSIRRLDWTDRGWHRPGIGQDEGQKTMAKPAVPPTATDDEVRALLLVRYRCPVPFHEVRTRLLGNIASPGMGASPIKVVEGLWGGKLPEFETIDAANELVGGLVMGLWNRLSRHQDRNAPFRLTRIETEATREGLAALAMLRRQELEGFVEGLFGKEEALDFPERAHRGLGALSEMWALFEGTEAVAREEAKTGTERDMEKTLRLLRQMTKDAEHEIHAILLSCKRARRQMLASLPAQKPTLH